MDSMVQKLKKLQTHFKLFLKQKYLACYMKELWTKCLCRRRNIVWSIDDSRTKCSTNNIGLSWVKFSTAILIYMDISSFHEDTERLNQCEFFFRPKIGTLDTHKSLFRCYLNNLACPCIWLCRRHISIHATTVVMVWEIDIEYFEGESNHFFSHDHVSEMISRSK